MSSTLAYNQAEIKKAIEKCLYDQDFFKIVRECEILMRW